MSSLIRVIPEAEEDVRDAAAWYNRKRNGLGKDFFLVVSAELSFIASNPESLQIIYEGIRRKPLNRFPYSIYYELADGKVTVIAILHQKRHASIWKKRKY